MHRVKGRLREELVEVVQAGQRDLVPVKIVVAQGYLESVVRREALPERSEAHVGCGECYRVDLVLVVAFQLYRERVGLKLQTLREGGED